MVLTDRWAAASFDRRRRAVPPRAYRAGPEQLPAARTSMRRSERAAAGLSPLPVGGRRLRRDHAGRHQAGASARPARSAGRSDAVLTPRSPARGLRVLGLSPLRAPPPPTAASASTGSSSPTTMPRHLPNVGCRGRLLAEGRQVTVRPDEVDPAPVHPC